MNRPIYWISNSRPIHTDNKPYYLNITKKTILLYSKKSMLRAPVSDSVKGSEKIETVAEKGEH